MTTSNTQGDTPPIQPEHADFNVDGHMHDCLFDKHDVDSECTKDCAAWAYALWTRCLEGHQPALERERLEAKAVAYDDAAFWLQDRLTTKKDVADICSTRAKVLRGEIEAPKSRFTQDPQAYATLTNKDKDNKAQLAQPSEEKDV